MAKQKTLYVCGECGHTEPKWLGRCPECGQWNSFQLTNREKNGTTGTHAKKTYSVPMDSIQTKEILKYDTGIPEINRVLGGGVTKGSSVLLGGEPGIGKSTLMLQMAGAVVTSGRILYITGEESPAQIKKRAERLSIQGKTIELLSETNIDSINQVIETVHPVLIIVDSIQTIYCEELGSVPGTVNQIKYCAQEIISWTRERESAVFFIAHVTKEGVIAGPKVMEHMVDTVLYFDKADSDIRFVRPGKNRFGPIDEIGLFTMDEKGLKEVTDPSSLFMLHRTEQLPSGLAIAAVYEGSRILLVELQALTVPAKGSISRVFSDRIDSGRVSRIAAVLEKHAGLRFSDQDIYVNVAGGIRLSEVGIELPLAMALYSARTDIPLPSKTVLAGEVGLTGEIRPISHMKRRVKSSADMGFPTFIGPGEGGQAKNREESNLREANTIPKAIEQLFGKST